MSSVAALPLVLLSAEDGDVSDLDEERVFWLVCGLMREFGSYFAPDLGGVVKDTRLLGRLLAHALPQLSAHLECAGLDALLFTSKWFLTLGCDGLNALSSSLLRIWDVACSSGRKGLLRVTLAVLTLCHDHVRCACDVCGSYAVGVHTSL